jgi:hypothetical protein
MKLLKLLLCAAVSLVITGCPGFICIFPTDDPSFEIDLYITNDSSESLWIYFSRIQEEKRIPLDDPLTENIKENGLWMTLYQTYNLEEYADEYASFSGHIEFCRVAADGDPPSKELIKKIDNADSVLIREESRDDSGYGTIVYKLIVTNEMLGIE